MRSVRVDFLGRLGDFDRSSRSGFGDVSDNIGNNLGLDAAALGVLAGRLDHLDLGLEFGGWLALLGHGHVVGLAVHRCQEGWVAAELTDGFVQALVGRVCGWRDQSRVVQEVLNNLGDLVDSGGVLGVVVFAEGSPEVAEALQEVGSVLLGECGTVGLGEGLSLLGVCEERAGSQQLGETGSDAGVVLLVVHGGDWSSGSLGLLLSLRRLGWGSLLVIVLGQVGLDVQFVDGFEVLKLLEGVRLALDDLLVVWLQFVGRSLLISLDLGELLVQVSSLLCQESGEEIVKLDFWHGRLLVVLLG